MGRIAAAKEMNQYQAIKQMVEKVGAIEEEKRALLGWGAYAAVLVIVLLIAALAYVGSMVKTVPIVLEVDKHGNVQEVRVDMDVVSAKEMIIKRELQEFIERTFRVVTDADLKNKDTQWVAAHLDSSTGLHGRIQKLYTDQKQSPYERAKREIVSIAVETPIRKTSKTFDVAWKEVVKDRATGEVIAVRKMKGIMSIRAGGSLNEWNRASPNPLGIIVEEFDWVRVGGGDE